MSNRVRTGVIYQDVKEEGCTWQDCKDNHPDGEAPTYSNKAKGITKRKSSKLRSWNHPSVIFMDTNKHKVYKTTKMEKAEYIKKSDGKKSSYNFATKSKVGTYRCARHHVIPCEIFEKIYKKLAHNVGLLGIDINNEHFNGITLAYYPPDMVWHDLQYHLSKHDEYTRTIKKELKKIAVNSLKYCDDDNPETKTATLEDELREAVMGFRKRIYKQGLKIHSDVSAKRITEFTLHSDAKKVPSVRPKIVYPDLYK